MKKKVKKSIKLFSIMEYTNCLGNGKKDKKKLEGKTPH
jgi:hypothetical protein